MSDLDIQIEAAIAGAQEIPRAEVLRWIASATELHTLAKLYRLTDQGYWRIQPELGKEATCGLIQQYLPQCIKADVKDDEEILERWYACGELHTWFRHLLKMDGGEVVLREAARAITDLFLASEEDVRNMIEGAFLEHALETEGLRPYFESWASNAELRDAFERALAWGKAHPDYMEQMLRRLSKDPE